MLSYATRHVVRLFARTVENDVIAHFMHLLVRMRRENANYSELSSYIITRIHCLMEFLSVLGQIN